MRRTAFVCSSALAALLPLTAIAASSSSAVSSASTNASWQKMYDALNAWQTDLSVQGMEIQLQESDRLFQTNASLFPDLSTLGGTVPDVLDAAMQKRTAAYVTAHIAGKDVVFTDTSSAQWYAPYIRNMAELGILTGYRDTSGNLTGLFGPGDPVTVEQVAKAVISALGISPSQCPQIPLNVTASGSWSAPYVACAEKNQWTVYSDGTVNAHRPETRAEVVTTVLQAFKIQPAQGTGTGFTDVSPSMQNAGYIEQAAKDNIIGGYTDASGRPTGLFGPNDGINRAEFAKILSLAMQVYKKQ